MKRSKLFRGCVIALTCTGMMSAQLAQAAGPTTVTPATPVRAASNTIQDISLQDGGVLTGTVLDDQGAPRAQVPVLVSRQGNVVAKTETDANGQFTVQQLNGGVYEVQTAASTGIFRLWAPRTAPPAAQTVAVLAPQAGIVRAQMRGGSALSWLANPWVLAGLVAAAIAIPLALDDDDAS
jgi:hypothetical protein